MQLQGKETPQRHKLHTAGAGVGQKSEKNENQLGEEKKKKSYNSMLLFKNQIRVSQKSNLLIYIFLSVFCPYSIQHRDLKPQLLAC